MTKGLKAKLQAMAIPLANANRKSLKPTKKRKDKRRSRIVRSTDC